MGGIFHKILLVIILFGATGTFAKTKLIRVKDFGDNPRGLRMYVYTPPNLSINAPLVVVLHGCTQNAKQSAALTDWNKLADENGFMVVYPQQVFKNNPGKCFNWHTRNNQHRASGEPASIIAMVKFAINEYRVDSNRVYITGMSAGGAMAANMLATYPDVFKSGAIFAGGAYRSASNIFTGSLAMRGWIIQPAERLGAKVKEAYPQFTGSYPTVNIFHGRRDIVVNKRNARELVKQWTNIHKTDFEPDSIIEHFKGNKRVRLYMYNNQAGEAVVSYFSFARTGHAMPINPGKCPCNGGGRKPFSRDINFFATYNAAELFGLIKQPCEAVATNNKKCN